MVVAIVILAVVVFANIFIFKYRKKPRRHGRQEHETYGTAYPEMERDMDLPPPYLSPPSYAEVGMQNPGFENRLSTSSVEMPPSYEYAISNMEVEQNMLNRSRENNGNNNIIPIQGTSRSPTGGQTGVSNFAGVPEPRGPPPPPPQINTLTGSGALNPLQPRPVTRQAHLTTRGRSTSQNLPQTSSQRFTENPDHSDTAVTSNPLPRSRSLGDIGKTPDILFKLRRSSTEGDNLNPRLGNRTLILFQGSKNDEIKV